MTPADAPRNTAVADGPLAVRWATAREIAEWDTLLAAAPQGGYVLQAQPFALTKSTVGWRPLHLIADDRRPILVLERTVFPLGRLWYAPKGPVSSSARDLGRLLPGIRARAAERHAFLVTVEPELPLGDEDEIRALGLVKSHDIQMATSTILVPLEGRDLDEMLAHISPKMRHGIRKAERSGVETSEVPVTEDTMRAMHSLLVETAHAAHFPTRSYAYYSTFWSDYAAAGEGHMFFARHEGDVVTAAYVVLLGKRAYYKDGASHRSRSAYGTSDALQWHILTWLRTAHPEVTSYDLMGCPPSAEIENPDHPLYGVGFFKHKISKNVVDYTGGYDLVLGPRRRKVWEAGGRRVALALSWRLHHHTFY